MRMLETLWQDLRYAVRSLRRAPVFATAAILTLGAGIGANTALFTVTRGVLLKTLPVPEPEQLVEIGCINPNNPEEACRTHYPGFLMYRSHTDLLSGVFAFAPTRELAANIDGRADMIAGLMVSGNAYDVLGLRAYAGRLLMPADDNPGAPLVGVLSHEYWERRFGGDRDVVGRSVRLGNQLVTIVGVTPPAFRGLTVGMAPDVTLPISSAEIFRQPGSLQARAALWVYVMGRTKPGVTARQVQAALEPTFHETMRVTLEALPPAVAAGFRDFIQGFRFRVSAAATGGVSDFRRMLEQPLRILWGLAAFVLLITCANLAGLLLSRAVDRRREFGVRLALGAGRARLARQVFTEALLLALVGGALGVLIARFAAPVGMALGAGENGLRAVDFHPDIYVLAFTALVSAVTAVAIGLATIWKTAGADPVEAWRAPVLHGRAPFARTFVVAQMAFTTVLVVGAALFVKSLANARSVDPGFDQEHLITATVAPGMAGHDPDAAVEYLTRVVAAAESVPGVRSATYHAVPVATGLVSQTGVAVAGFTGPAEQMVTGQNRVGPRFIETLGLRLISGRDFRPGDERSSNRVAVVNEQFARLFFRTTDVIGRTFILRDRVQEYSIVGVVRNAHDRSVTQPTENWIYIPFTPDAAPRARVTVRTNDGVLPVLAAVERAIQRVDSSVPVYGVGGMTAQIDETLRRERLLATLGTAFGALTLGLVAIGVYAMFSTMVTRRRREIGVRMAVGADARRIAALIAREAAIVALCGVGAGVLGATAAATVIRNQLFNVEPTDPRWILAGVAILIATVVLAVMVPTRRALAVHPALTLRAE